MTFAVRLGKSRVGLLGLFLALVFLPTVVARASNTNVFLLKNSLKAATESGAGIQTIKFKTDPQLLLGTNTTLTLAIAVTDIDCDTNGFVQAHFQLVAFNSSPQSQKIVSTLVDFVNPTFIFNGDKMAVVRVTGEGREGVNAADWEALINFSYDPCSGGEASIKNVLIQPVGLIKPALAPPFLPTLIGDAGQLEILSDDPDHPQILLPITGLSERPVPSCDIDLNPTSLDFGTVDLSTNKVLHFQIRNNGATTCTVSSATLNTGSAFAIVNSPASAILAPAAFVDVDMRFSPVAAGPDSDVVTVTTTDPTNPIQSVTLSGRGLAGAGDCTISASPVTLNFGTVEINDNKTIVTTLSNSGGTTCTVESVTLANPAGEFTLVSSLPAFFPMAPGSSTNVSVRYTPVDSTVDTNVLQITTVSSNLTDVVLIGAGKVGQCSLDVSPSTVNFGAVAVGTNRNLAVTITNSGLTSCDITGVTNLNPGEFSFVPLPTIPTTVPGGSSVNLSVSYAPTNGGADSATLRITATDPDSPANITLNGLGVPPSPNCAINVDPSSLLIEFQTVTVGKTGTAIVGISNTGGSGCTVNSLNLIGSSRFSLIAPSTPFPVSVNGTNKVAVRYIPTGNITDTGTLQIFSDDPGNPLISVSLNGAGFQCDLLVTPLAVAFGDVPVGSSITNTVTIQNTNNVVCRLDGRRLTGSSDFRFTSNSSTGIVNLVLNATSSVGIIYEPSGRGSDNGNLVIDSPDIASPIIVPLTGTGLEGQLTVTPSSLSFGKVVLGGTNTIDVLIRSSGTTTATVTSVRVLNNGNIRLVGPNVPLILPALSNATVSVSYVPANIQTVIIQGGKLKSSGKPIIVGP